MTIGQSSFSFDELLAEKRFVLVLDQLVLQALLLDFVDALIDPCQRAEFDQQVFGRFGPDRGHAGDVVRGVSGQRQEILHLIDAHAEALFDLRRRRTRDRASCPT